MEHKGDGIGRKIVENLPSNSQKILEKQAGGNINSLNYLYTTKWWMKNFPTEL